MPRSFSFVLLAAVAACTRLSAQAAEPVDWIVTARYVITMDASHRIIPRGALAVRGHDIVAVDTETAILNRYRAAQILRKPDAVVTPGLIDTHTHAPMSLMRAIADDQNLNDWLTKFIFPAEAHNVSPEFVRWGTRLACLEMVLAGITTYTDMYYFEDVEAAEAKRAGVRGVLGQSVIGFPAPDFKTWQEAIAGTKKYMDAYRNDDLIVPAVAPHSIYTTPDEALRASHELAASYHLPLLIHLAETRKERDDALRTRGLTPTQTLEHLGLLDGRVVAAHSIWESDDDLAILKKHGTGVAHCPSSNTKLASGVAKVTAMLQLGIPVGLGTDGFAGSNDGADILREMDLAAKLQKVTLMDPTVLPAGQAFEMATMGGARVLGLDKTIGSLEAGKRADFIALSLAHPDTAPLYHLLPVIVYSAHAGDVDDVFINGRQIVRSRQVLTLNAPEILSKAAAFQKQIEASLTH